MIITNYLCSFTNPTTGEKLSVIVELDETDEAAVEYHRQSEGEEQADFVAKGAALRRAYQAVPKGFLHVCEPERRSLQ